jgi:hypothetical protein
MSSTHAVDALVRLLGDRLPADRVFGRAHPVYAAATRLWNGGVPARPCLIIDLVGVRGARG